MLMSKPLVKLFSAAIVLQASVGAFVLPPRGTHHQHHSLFYDSPSLLRDPPAEFQPHHQQGRRPGRRGRGLTTTTSLKSLIPLETDELDQLVALGSPTAAQYSTYFGRTQQERYARFVESAIISFLGLFFSYFMSFVLGGWVATMFGALFLFWGILSPEFKARQRNWEFLGGRPLVDVYHSDGQQAGLYGALFVGVIEDVCVVQNSDDVLEYDLAEFVDYRMEQDELERFTGVPWLMRVKCVDFTSRRLQVHARLSEEYMDLAPGVGVLGILLSKSPDFTTLAALTDLFCPSAQCWIGDYPYLDRAEMELLLTENDSVWDAFVLEEESALLLQDENSEQAEARKGSV